MAHNMTVAKIREMIEYLYEEYGADCLERDLDWWTEDGCASCQARFVIDFLSRDIEMGVADGERKE